MLKDNFNKICLVAIAFLVLVSLCFTLKVNAEEFDAPADAAESVPSVQVYDPDLYAKLDSLQESVNALSEVIAADTQNTAPDYTEQLSGISDQLQILAEQAEPETDTTSAFDKSFSEYSLVENLLLILSVILGFNVFSLIIKNFIL
ncbi:hypothetical protein [uncultured Gemmiger sp.]|uniref:hypothetical protein n=1 Tax=uncultured Gemmiger sp. TaxID=1623490 RepID=UPI0025EA3693|nr:hypothetical protein [uncultured Gemmiger sp.]